MAEFSSMAISLMIAPLMPERAAADDYYWLIITPLPSCRFSSFTRYFAAAAFDTASHICH
jgi:hypothetical protein